MAVEELEATLRAAAPPDSVVEAVQPSIGMAISVKIMYWLGFVALIGLLPILLRALFDSFRGAGVHWTNLLGTGELLPISAVIGGATLGEVFESGRRPRSKVPRGWREKTKHLMQDFLYFISLMATVLSVIFNVFIYAILFTLSDLQGLNARNWSEVLFAITVVSSAVVVGSVRKI